VSGTIIAIHTTDFDYKGHVHHASEDDAQYEIKSDKTDHIAAHTKAARLNVHPSKGTVWSPHFSRWPFHPAPLPAPHRTEMEALTVPGSQNTTSGRPQTMYARENAVNTGYSGKGTNKLRRDWGTFAQPQQPASSLARQSCGDGEAVPGKARLDVSEVGRRDLAAAAVGEFLSCGCNTAATWPTRAAEMLGKSDEQRM
jgi:hypothetical protein